MTEDRIKKLHSKIRVDIKPNSTVSIPILGDTIIIPEDHYGKAFIRKSLAMKSLLLADSPFPPGWIGHPTLTISNVGPNVVEIIAGQELGELYIARF